MLKSYKLATSDRISRFSSININGRKLRNNQIYPIIDDDNFVAGLRSSELSVYIEDVDVA